LFLEISRRNTIYHSHFNSILHYMRVLKWTFNMQKFTSYCEYFSMNTAILNFLFLD